MIRLKKYQVERISKKKNILGQCEWFRRTYGCTMEVRGDYYLEFKTQKEETFFLLKYSNELNNPKEDTWEDIQTDIRQLLQSWTFDEDDIDPKS
jgi:hypothetical protein